MIGKVAYMLELPAELILMHLIFHVSILWKFVSDLSLVVPTVNIGAKKSLKKL